MAMATVSAKSTAEGDGHGDGCDEGNGVVDDGGC
jgi:hypothetical protein